MDCILLRSPVLALWEIMVKVNLFLCLTKYYAAKTYGGVNVQFHVFLISALVGGECAASRSCRFSPRESLRHPLDRRLGGPQSRSA
jgi:hypothetical protein